MTIMKEVFNCVGYILKGHNYIAVLQQIIECHLRHGLLLTGKRSLSLICYTAPLLVDIEIWQ